MTTGYLALACPCGEVWAAEARHARVACTRCGKPADTATRQALWRGDSAGDARAAVASLRAARAGAPEAALRPAERTVRHDDPLDAAAAKARGTTNLSRRAEAVARWLTRLVGQPTHAQLLEAMQRAGIDAGRAEREVVRMLACDLITEPRAGTYRMLDA